MLFPAYAGVILATLTLPRTIYGFSPHTRG